MSPDLPSADNPDDVHPVFSVRAGGFVNDNLQEDRTHRATIDGHAHANYISPSGQILDTQVTVCDRFPEQRRILKVRVTVLNEPGIDLSGDGVINTVLGPQMNAMMHVDAEISRATIGWAQACIKVEQEGIIRFLDAPAPGGVNIIADMLFQGMDDIAIATDPIHSAGISPNVLEVYFVARIPGAFGFTRAPECGIPQIGGNTFCFIGIEELPPTGPGGPHDIRLRILAHEIGHALDNLSNLDGGQPPYIFYPFRARPFDNSVLLQRRIRHDTEESCRVPRLPDPAFYGDAGNTLLFPPP